MPPNNQRKKTGPPKSSIPSNWTSSTALAQGLGIPLTVLKADKRAGCPAFRTNNSVNLEEWIRWHFEQSGESKQLESYTEAKARETRERANILEIERRQKEGDLVPLDKIEEYITKWVAPVTQRLRSMPDRLGPMVNPADPTHAREVINQERAQLFGLGWLAGQKPVVAKKSARKRPAKKAAKKATKKAVKKKGK